MQSGKQESDPTRLVIEVGEAAADAALDHVRAIAEAEVRDRQRFVRARSTRAHSPRPSPSAATARARSVPFSTLLLALRGTSASLHKKTCRGTL